MKPLLKLTLAGSLLFMMASCSQDSETWSKYSSTDGGFSVTMPGNPVKSEKTVATAFGKQVVHFISWKPTAFAIDKFKLFEVSYTNAPARASSDSMSINAALDSCINIRKKDFTEADIVSEAIELNGYPARSFIYESGNSIATVKECIVNNKLYDLTVISKKNYATNAESGNFFNSFQSLR
jgi:hypothetical protein